MLTLESFKLLNPKVAQVERSTGGTPDITFQEVSDLLSRCSRQCSVYARYQYALDDTSEPRLVEQSTTAMVTEDRKRKRPILPKRGHWQRLTEMVVRTRRSNIWLTRRQRAVAADFRRWTRRTEEAYKNVGTMLDEWDYELRSELGQWNRYQVEDSR